VQKA